MVKFRDNLYIGGMKDALDRDVLNEKGITAVLNVAYELNDPIFHWDIRMMKVGLVDSSDNEAYMKSLACSTLALLLDQKNTVLVHCAAGQSRSVFVALVTLSELEDKDWTVLYDELIKIHPAALVGPLFHGHNAYYQFYKKQEEEAQLTTQ